MRGLSLVIAVSGLLSMVGCGGPTGPRRVQVYGNIQVDGQIMEEGVVRFLPGDGNRGPAANTVISRGAYSFTATDGPLPGLYRVQIAKTLPPAGKFEAGTNATLPRLEWLVMVKVPDETSYQKDFRQSAKDPEIVSLE